jgi:hypothetical protein
VADNGTRTWDEVRAAAIQAVSDAAADEFAGDPILQTTAERLADAVLAVVDEEAVSRMTETFVNETRIRAMDFRHGVSMDLVPSETLVAHWVAAAKAWLDEHPAPNYTETPLEFGAKAEMEVKLAGELVRYVFILQKIAPGTLTPHEARKKAEAERDQALAELARLREAGRG